MLAWVGVVAFSHPSHTGWFVLLLFCGAMLALAALRWGGRYHPYLVSLALILTLWACTLLSVVLSPGLFSPFPAGWVLVVASSTLLLGRVMGLWAVLLSITALLLTGGSLNAEALLIWAVIYLGSFSLMLVFTEGHRRTLDMLGKQQKAQETLQAGLQVAEDHTQAFEDALPDLVVRVTQHGRVLDVHAAEGQALPVRAEFLVGRPLQDVLDVRAAEAVLQAVEWAVSGAGIQTLEIETQLYRQGQFTYDCRVSRLSDSHALVFLRDITEQKQAQQAQQRRLRQMERLDGLSSRLAAGGNQHENILLVVAEQSALLVDSVCLIFGVEQGLLGPAGRA